jgi:lipid II isoglutaminyl synthase (glutamine-hydrolysing)
MNFLLIYFGKLLSLFSRIFNVGSGSTWPGHIALYFNKNFIKDILRNSKVKIILIAGTNGKTTTGKLIQSILEENNKKVFQNEGGANLLNGIASSLISNSNLYGKIDKDFAVFEIDENTLPLILQQINNPDFIMVLNLFRDQLDRYGEVNTIANKWREAFKKLNDKTTLILNADDPQVSSLGLNLKTNVSYFGINSKNKTEKIQHASDSTHCPNCGEKLFYSSTYFSHLGEWYCKECNYKHPEKVFTSSPHYPLLGIYNQYNTNAAVLLANKLGLEKEKILSSLKNFKPAFGRQEILNIYGKKVQIFLSKNPTGLNESLKTIESLNAKNLLIILNDRIPDGRDVSWIWDVDFEDFSSQFKNIVVSGDRTYDMGLRLKYAEYKNFTNEENLTKAIDSAIKETDNNETLYILSTYSATLDVRKILTGKKIL